MAREVAEDDAEILTLQGATGVEDTDAAALNIALDEVVDDLHLVAVDPASERGEEELERGGFGHRTRTIGQPAD